MAATISVTVRQVREDGTEGPLEEELAAALAGPVEQFTSMLSWTAQQAAALDHGDRENVIADSGRELQRRLLESTFTIDCAQEMRIEQVTSAAGIRHGTVDKGHDRGVTSIFGPVRATRLAYRNRREANLYPADAKWILPDDPYPLGMRSLTAYHLAAGGYGQAQDVIEARTGVKIGQAQLAGLAGNLAAWADDFCAERARDAGTCLPWSDVIMMQAGGKGIAMRPEHRASAGQETDAAHPGIKKMAGIVDGNKQQITAIKACAKDRDLNVPVFIDYIHVSGYIGKAAAALHPGGPQAAREWADGQKLPILHGRAKAVAATLASVAARTRAKASTRHLDLTDVDKAVTYLTNNHQHMHYDKALAAGWPIATGMIEGACRFVIEDRFGITGARWSPDGAEVILKLRALVVSSDLDDYMTYYKKRYLNEIHLNRYDPASIADLGLTA